MAPKKEIINVITLQIQAGKATPAPPLGPILGQSGVPIPDFCSKFNEMTRNMGDDVLPLKLTVFKDRTFAITLKQPTVAGMVKKAAGIPKGSANPKKDKVGKITKAQARQIAERKMPDLNTPSVDSAVNTVIGTARSLGVEVID